MKSIHNIMFETSKIICRQQETLVFACCRNLVKTLGIFLFFVVSAYADDALYVGSFAKSSLTGWKVKEFNGETKYSFINVDRTTVLKAESNAAASGLFYEKKIDLELTPVMNWRWRVELPLTKLNEQEKSGDDFAARVYVVVSGGLVFWNTKAINYVWANTTPKGKTWPNPFAGDHAMMVAVRSSDDKVGMWYTEKRNIRDDFKKLKGEDVRFIDAVALMTDTDNSSGKAVATYGDIYFTAD
jgi:Protein of unknown function (DUF3047)